MPICRKKRRISIFRGMASEGLTVRRLETNFKRYSCINFLTSSCWWVPIRLLSSRWHSNSSKVYLKDEHTSCAIFYVFSSVRFSGPKLMAWATYFLSTLHHHRAHTARRTEEKMNKQQRSLGSEEKNLYSQQIKRRFRKQIRVVYITKLNV